MTRHPVRWDSLVFGLLFLLALGYWLVWRTDALSTLQVNVAASAALIAVGLLGIVVTLLRDGDRRRTPPPAPVTPTPDLPEGEHHDEEDPRPQH